MAASGRRLKPSSTDVDQHIKWILFFCQVSKVWKPREDRTGAEVWWRGGKAPDRRRHCPLQSTTVSAQAQHHGPHRKSSFKVQKNNETSQKLSLQFLNDMRSSDYGVDVDQYSSLLWMNPPQFASKSHFQAQCRHRKSLFLSLNQEKKWKQISLFDNLKKICYTFMLW